MQTIKKFIELSKNNPKTDIEIVLKLQEEVGEVSAALLSAMGTSGSQYKKNTLEDVKEELIDVLMIAGSLLVRMSSEEEILNVLETKVQKWSTVK